MRPSRVVILRLLAHGVALAGAVGQVPAPTTASYRHRLLGVYDAQSGEPVEGARVVDILAHLTALTTRTGTVSLAFLPEGESVLRIEKIGFQPTSLIVEISPSDTLPLTVVLKALALTLPAVITKDSAPHYISGRLRDFEERRKHGFGHYYSEADLRKHDSEKMTTLVRRLPGVKVTCPSYGFRAGQCWALPTRGGCPRAVDVYIDGIPSMDNDLQKLNIDQFAGAEYYAGHATIPAEYSKPTSCGVLLFWTRER